MKLSLRRGSTSSFCGRVCCFTSRTGALEGCKSYLVPASRAYPCRATSCAGLDKCLLGSVTQGGEREEPPERHPGLGAGRGGRADEATERPLSCPVQPQLGSWNTRVSHSRSLAGGQPSPGPRSRGGGCTTSAARRLPSAPSAPGRAGDLSARPI